jgi:hypothetical protein
MRVAMPAQLETFFALYILSNDNVDGEGVTVVESSRQDVSGKTGQHIIPDQQAFGATLEQRHAGVDAGAEKRHRVCIKMYDFGTSVDLHTRNPR